MKLRIMVKRPERRVKSYKRMLADEKEKEQQRKSMKSTFELERSSSTMNFDDDEHGKKQNS